MTATEIRKAEKTTLKSRPVFVQGIMQPALHELTAELDARVNGVTLRLPAGCVIGVTAGGAGGLVGSLLTEVEFVGRDGRTYRASQGMQVVVPAGA